MGGSDKNERLRHGDGAPKHKRPSLFRKLGDRILRAFHRKPRDRRARIDDNRYSHSTGDLISDVPEQTTKESDAFLPSGDRHDLPGLSLSAEDRAVSEGHLQGACGGSRNQPSEFLSPKAAFLSSDFRNELSSKLRLPPRNQTTRSTGVGIKTADSSGSLVSDDSTFFSPTGGSDERLTSDDVVNTHNPDGSVKSSPSLASSFLAGTQHKLAVNKRRNRRPPTLFTASTPLRDSHNQGPLDSSCASFFGGSGSSLSASHATRLDFITEEENEQHSSTPQTPMPVPQNSRSQSAVHPYTESDDKTTQFFDEPKAAALNDITPFSSKESDVTSDLSTVDPFTKSRLTSQDFCETKSPSQPTSTHCTRVKYHSTQKRTLSDNEDDRVLSQPKTSSTQRSTTRPVSMYTPVGTIPEHTANGPTGRISPLPPRKRLQTLECYIKTDFPASEPHNRAEKLSSDHGDQNVDDEPELKSVADRASVFGATLHSPKPAPPRPPSPTSLRRRNIEQSETVANNRASRVFSLVKNFEQSC